MTDVQRLALVRGVHTAIYVVMAISTFVLLYAGVTGAQGGWLWVALGLLAIEVIVFAVSGMKCPVSAPSPVSTVQRLATFSTHSWTSGSLGTRSGSSEP